MYNIDIWWYMMYSAKKHELGVPYKIGETHLGINQWIWAISTSDSSDAALNLTQLVG